MTASRLVQFTSDSATSGGPAVRDSIANAASLHPFDELIGLVPTQQGEFAAATSPAYSNMVGPFGGATAAQMLAAVLATEDCVGTPVAITVNFMAPVLEGPFRLRVRKTRQNRSSQHWYVEMVQGEGDEVRTNATVMTAARRDTWQSSEALPPDVLAQGPDRFERLKTNMAWVDQYEFAFIEGHPLPPEASEAHASSRTSVWVKHAMERRLDFPGLLALSDTFLPRIQLRRTDWTAVGTVSMTTYFHCQAPALHVVGAEPLLGVAQGRIFTANYFDQDSQLWSVGGQCLATSHQVVYFKA